MWVVALSATLAMTWIARTSATYTGHPTGPMVHLFEWKFDDIAKECEEFLAPKGYAGVQVSPVSENIIISDRPWWERYQPISYKLVTRSGDEAAFRNMCERCNKVGIRIYPDVVLNHMTAASGTYRVGTGGSTADTDNLYYPAVPYTPEHFHTPACSISDYNDASQVRNCELSGLHDLDQYQPYVRGKIVEYLDHLISCGAAGFRVDAAKHMWPSDLQYIFSRVKNLNTSQGFDYGARPYVYQEVAGSGTDGASQESEYRGIGHVTDFKFGYEISNAFRGNNDLKWLSTFGESWGLIPSDKAVVFIDNHDTQRGDGYGGDTILNYKEPRLYKMAVAFMLAWPYGIPQVMSGFHFSHKDQGPPSNADESTANVQFIGDTCMNGWGCEHRWRQISNMVGFRNVVQGEPVTNWWDNGKNQIAFCRGNKGFIVINSGSDTLSAEIQTSLLQGTYCDVISGNLVSGHCTGKTVTVDRDSKATVQISPSTDEDGVMAIHTGARIN